MAIARNVILALVVLSLYSTKAQPTEVFYEDSATKKVLPIKVLTQLWLADSTATSEMQERVVHRHLQKQGYWLAKVRTASDSLWLRAGTQLTIGNMQIVNSEAFSFLQNLPKGATTLNDSNLQFYIARYLRAFENNGFPFAQAYLQDYRIQENILHGALAFEKGPPVTLDSAIVKGYLKLHPKLLRYDLQYEKGMPYREEYLQELPELIQQTEYLSMRRAPAVGFFEQDTRLYLYLTKEKANRIDGVVGLNTEDNGQTTVNGQFQLRLLNVFNGGEDIALEWQRPDESVQLLDVGLTLPYLFTTPFWLQTKLNIYRQDSSFVNTQFKGQLKYQLSHRSFLTGSFLSKNSTLLSSTEALSDRGSVKNNMWGLGIEINQTNRAIIPTQGYLINMSARSGQRTTADTIRTQWGWEVQGSLYHTFWQRHVLKSSLRSEALIGAGFFENELFRLGGLRSLRGFNEQSIFTSAYVMATLEYRFMLGTYDYLTLFGDYAYTQKNTQSNRSENYLTGIGTGLNFKTGAGIFSLFFAVGKSQDTPFDFVATKVHVGYINTF